MFRRIAKAIRNNILVGLVLATPIVVTGFIINWAFRFTTNRVLPLSLETNEHQLLYRAAALLTVLLVLFLIGLFVRNILGKKLYQFGDLILTRIPVINRVYIYVRQISEAVLAQRQGIFQEVAAIEYPRKGLYSIAFITGVVPASLRDKMSDNKTDDWVSLFLPTTPNPTSGLLIMAPRSDLVILPYSVADAMKLVISGGVAYPGSGPDDPQPTLLDKLDALLGKHTGGDSHRSVDGQTDVTD